MAEDAKDDCEAGVCEIVGAGSYHEQQDSVICANLGGKAAMQMTFREMQSSHGNHQLVGSTACMTVTQYDKC